MRGMEQRPLIVLVDSIPGSFLIDATSNVDDDPPVW
jgi:hypothetical protein